MPELPEVQTIADDLNRKVGGAVITGFWTDWPKLVKKPTAAVLKRGIKDARIEKVTREGKNVLFHLDKERLLLIHQKMTGHLMVGKWQTERRKGGWNVKSLIKGPFEDRVNQYIHAIFYLRDGRMIALSDMRKFARVAFGKRQEILTLPDIRTLGPDALDPKLGAGRFGALVGRRKRAVKSVLMDPAVVAGVGNIYADDILWSAKVHPLRRADGLSDGELRRIFSSMRRILKKAVGLRGTSVGDYRDTAGEPGRYNRVILAYQRTGKPCRRCKTPIRKIKTGQRSSHFCPKCQKL